jgi:hypothetical protein
MKFRLFLLIAIIFFVIGTILPEPALAAPLVSISPRSGAPGTTVVVSASNFGSYIGDRLSVFFNGAEIPRITIFVPLSGVFQVTFEVPQTTEPGDAIVSLRGESGESIAQEIFTVPVPELVLGTWAGEVATELEINARGFQVGKTVDFSFDFGESILPIGSEVAKDTGECSIQFTIPESPRGKHRISAWNKEGQRAEAEFSIIPSISVSPTTAAVGDTIAIRGTGFTSSNEVSVNLYNESVATTVASVQGSFDTQFVVPVLKAGKYLVDVEDVNREIKWTELIITSRIVLSKNLGEVGAKLTISGTGFGVRRVVTVKYDTEEMTNLKTDGTGAFTGTFIVPISTTGPHVITASDGYDLRQVMYEVESDAPVAPEPLSPKEYGEVSSPIVLDWEGVYDISQPLVYDLQVARTADFRHPVLEKSGLISSQFNISNGDTLLPNRRGSFYYWRVRAIDGASNVGEWSTPAVFVVKPMSVLPSWTKYVLILLQIVLTFVFGYRIWKNYQSEKKASD